MTPRRQLLAWVVVALAACAFLAGVFVQMYRDAQVRWSLFLVGNPRTGSYLFQEKGCAHCHAVNRLGGGLAPDLGSQRASRSSLNQLVTAMWNHAPRMWERMRTEKLAYPRLDLEEMAHLFSYLYTAGYIEEPGDANRGRQLFETKGCIQCHTLQGAGGRVGPDLSAVESGYTPILWAQAMWNHGPAMEAEMQKLSFVWPKFQDREMNDLLSYIQEASSGRGRAMEMLPADPERGWKVFQSKSCLLCHAGKGEGGRVGPELGPAGGRSLSIIQFAGLMWNHAPEMRRAMKQLGIAWPTFGNWEMADLIAFLSSVRYIEAGGSPQAGAMVFVRRGCSDCHGPTARGTRLGPRLRGQGKIYTFVTFATALWLHGPQMYQRVQQLGFAWPTLLESDVGDIIAFLNARLPGD